MLPSVALQSKSYNQNNWWLWDDETEWWSSFTSTGAIWVAPEERLELMIWSIYEKIKIDAIQHDFNWIFFLQRFWIIRIGFYYAENWAVPLFFKVVLRNSPDDFYLATEIQNTYSSVAFSLSQTRTDQLKTGEYKHIFFLSDASIK